MFNVSKDVHVLFFPRSWKRFFSSRVKSLSDPVISQFTGIELVFTSLLLRALRNFSERAAFSRLLSLATSAPLSALRSCKEFLHFRFDQNVIYLVFSGFTR